MGLFNTICNANVNKPPTFSLGYLLFHVLLGGKQCITNAITRPCGELKPVSLFSMIVPCIQDSDCEDFNYCSSDKVCVRFDSSHCVDRVCGLGDGGSCILTLCIVSSEVIEWQYCFWMCWQLGYEACCYSWRILVKVEKCQTLNRKLIRKLVSHRLRPARHSGMRARASVR